MYKSNHKEEIRFIILFLEGGGGVMMMPTPWVRNRCVYDLTIISRWLSIHENPICTFFAISKQIEKSIKFRYSEREDL